MTDLLKWRDEFPILSTCTHLISHSLGAMPRKTFDRMHEYAETWNTRGIRAWEEGWWDLPVTTGDLLAPILGVSPGSVVMHQNVSVAVAVVLSCFDLAGPRNRIVYTDMNFPSVMYVNEAARRNGADVVMVESDDGIGVDLEKVLAAIDERTLLVPVSHVLFRSGYVQDAEAIIRRAHEVGAHVVLDFYQSAGTVPIRGEEWNVDFLVGGSVKWLCGGPGAGYLHVREDLRRTLEPKITGWMAHAAPFEFEIGPQRYADDVRRFLHGSPAVPALYAARSGYEIVAAIGVDAIRANSKRQTARMIDLARDLDLTVRSPDDPERRGGTVVIDTEHGKAVVRELNRREILCDYRPGAGIRLSAHFYNTDEELDRTVREIREIVDTKAYEEHLGAKTTY
ncbi:MAG: aminotransferase class V-fold PLP-dependent enzyme [Planctomycetota bacterium JB042]